MTRPAAPPAPSNPEAATSGGNAAATAHSVKKVSAAEKKARAVELRKAGATFEEIAAAVGYSNKGSAYRAVAQALRDAVREPTKELITLEAARLDTMLRALWPQVARGNLGAIDRALKVADRRARLLGLDAAQQVQHTGRDGGPMEFVDLTPEEARAALAEVHAELGRRIQRDATDTRPAPDTSGEEP